MSNNEKTRRKKNKIKKLFLRSIYSQYYFNTLTANCDYSRNNKENLPLSIQMQIS